ncbi:hypothetical protein [Shewanella sp. KJ2020]|uniref:hypothetical protein n=1 Tax=Shewanella sp. KJ2020 TaxID=2919172 RepID=UPI0020A7AB2A|nr:hypothetical protein [Shewanella sp. KJ2020]MCP3127660.1 hypothetical protein [Shewanella sp. KJ2020]
MDVDSAIIKKVVNYSLDEHIFLKQFPHVLLGMCNFAILDEPDIYNSPNEYSSEYSSTLSLARELSGHGEFLEDQFSLLYLVLMPDLNNNRMFPCFFSDISDFGVDLFPMKDFLYSRIDTDSGDKIPEYRFFTDIGSNGFPSVRLFKDVFYKNYEMIMDEMKRTAKYALTQNPYINRKLSILKDLENMEMFFDSDSKLIL